MHHYLSTPDWLEELKEDLVKRGCTALVTERITMEHVKEDWLRGRETEDVADDIVAGKHPRFQLDQQPA
ncbi:MAG: hypothetical protein JNL05_10420 [Flavobacteriales bacterium]|nr:hypothetical protein [Flavobacteriales bacterium]